jgi:predicted lysophospholipase L1 biosynthesis ABC-type transport system permease subunit
MILTALQLTTRNPARAWLLARMASWVVVLSVLARLLPLSSALRIVSTGVRRKSTDVDVDPVQFSTAVDALLEANFFVFKPSCWKRATVLHRYLALAGVATTIRFGVKRDGESELKGHAWLELNGEPILESSPPVYTVTYSFPSNEPFNVDLAVLGQNQPSLTRRL